MSDILLLCKYLNEEFLSVGASQEEALKSVNELVTSRANNLFGYHGLAWELGRKNLEFFVLYFLQDIYTPKEYNDAAPLAEVHYEVWREIESAIIGDGHDQKGFILPRGTGKSAVGNIPVVVWSHAYKIKTYTLICSSTSNLAEKFIVDIKNIFLENERIASAFGTLLEDRNKEYKCNSTQLELTNRTMIESISSNSPMRGRKYNNVRPDLIILDDYQDEDDVKTEQARENKWKRYSDDVKFAIQKPLYRNNKLVKKGTTMVALGTVQHKEDFYSRLLNSPTWNFKKEKGVLVNDVDELFTTGLWGKFSCILDDFKNPNRLQDAKEFYWKHEEEMQFPLLWGEFWNCLDMALSYYENPNSFKQEVQGDVDSIGEKWFKGIRSIKRSEIEEYSFLRTMLLIDPASGGGRKNDYSAFLVGSRADDGFYYVRKGELAKINARTNFDEYINHALKLLVEYPEITHVYIEKNTFNGADANALENKINENDILKYRNITIINEMQKKNKDNKISTLIPYVNKGQIIFADEDEAFQNQVLDFRGQKFSTHDDAPDICAEFINRIDNIDVPCKIRILDRRKLGL